jgi:twitching motility protein PilT
MSDIAQYPQPKSTIDSRVDLSLFSPENIEILEILHAHAKGEKEIDRLFELLMQKKGSDLHISSNEHPIMRIDGAIRRLEHLPILIPIQIAQLLAPIIPDRNRKEFVERWDTDFAYEVAGVGRFRANIFMDRKGIGAVFRLIPSQVVTVEQLGLPKVLRDLCYLSKGLVLVTGPTGSGKSTTLCALVDLINRTRDDHIITIEDPIEFVHPNKRCLINQREVGVHTDSFKSALRAALREDPDVVLVGELRDLETMAIAIETAETGHLVFGTLHTSSAISTVDRLIDQFPGDRQQQIRLMLANSLKGIISQTLLRKKEGGRIAAMEILLITHGVANLIRQQKIHQIQSVMQTSQGIGMQCLNDILLNYVSRGIVDVLEAYTKAVDKLNFLDMLEHAGIKTDKLGVKGDDNLS